MQPVRTVPFFNLYDDIQITGEEIRCIVIYKAVRDCSPSRDAFYLRRHSKIHKDMTPGLCHPTCPNRANYPVLSDL